MFHHVTMDVMYGLALKRILIAAVTGCNSYMPPALSPQKQSQLCLLRTMAFYIAATGQVIRPSGSLIRRKSCAVLCLLRCLVQPAKRSCSVRPVLIVAMCHIKRLFTVSCLSVLQYFLLQMFHHTPSPATASGHGF